MKKFMNNLSAVALAVMATMMFASCEEDDDKLLANYIEQETKETVLIVSPTDLTMGSKKGEKANFTIKCDTSWTISGQSEWLSVSARSGNGDTQINLETLRANDSAEPELVTLTINSNGVSQSITITQLAGSKPLYVNLKNEIVMSDGFYSDLEFVGDVKGFHYACYYADRVRAWTDEDFKRDLKTEHAFSPEEFDYADYVLPASSTNYVYVAVAYNSQGEYGPIVKHEFTSKSSFTGYDAFVGNFKKESSRWTFDINMNTYCDRYYHYYLTDDYSGNLATYAAYSLATGIISSAFFARIIDDGIKQQSIEAAKKDGSKQLTRRSDETAIFFWTWGQNEQKVFSGNIQWDYCGSSSSARAPKRQSPNVDENGTIELNADKPTIQEVKALKQNLKVTGF